MTVDVFRSKVLIPANRATVWDFFSNPLNLSKLTPFTLALQIKDQENLPKEIYAGLIIHYTVQALPFIKSEWVTEITQMRKGEFFVDIQLVGPYSLWHHQHKFIESDSGIIMEDIVHYKIPGGVIGSAVFSGYVRSQLKEIFAYRTERIKEIFPGSTILNS